MGYVIKQNKVFAKMPDGKEYEFASVADYEHSFYDALFAANNGFFVEYPEDS